jgi:hypothetical protein
MSQNPLQTTYNFKITLFDGGKEVYQWLTPNYVYQSGKGLTFIDDKGHEVTVHGTYIVEDLR